MNRKKGICLIVHLDGVAVRAPTRRVDVVNRFDVQLLRDLAIMPSCGRKLHFPDLGRTQGSS